MTEYPVGFRDGVRTEYVGHLLKPFGHGVEDTIGRRCQRDDILRAAQRGDQLAVAGGIRCRRRLPRGT
jgi:hypothetical protein